MIIFHEGLPRAGKSYEAMKERIVPSIAKGRPVVAYVEGIDHDKIAALAGVPIERCRELLTALTRDQLQTAHESANGKPARIEDHLPELAVDNAMIVLDEAQNFWGNRAKLGPEMTKLITEHGHRGIDIVLMGQDIRDVHATWRRRVELKLSFLKLNGVRLPKWLQRLTFNKFGTEASYSVTTYRHLGGDEFQRLGLALRNYDPRFFGTYKSYVADDTNTAVYTDSRGEVWQHPLIKYVVPALLLAAVWGAYRSWSFFHPKTAPEAASTSTPSPVRSAIPRSAPTVVAAPASATVIPEQRSPIERRLVDLQGKGRIRLAGLISSKDRVSGIVEWVQGGNVVMERLSLDALRTLGVAVLVSGDTVQLAVGDFRDIATPWPLEDLTRVSEPRQAVIRGPVQQLAGAPLPPDVASMGRPSMNLDLPGPIQNDPDAGNLNRRVRRVTQPQ